MAVKTSLFFEHIDAFLDYRKTIYNASEQTLKLKLSLTPLIVIPYAAFVIMPSMA